MAVIMCYSGTVTSEQRAKVRMSLKRLAILLVILLAIPSFGAAKRSARAKYQFRKTHPCPATGRVKGPCFGYVIDHRIALCVGGKDEPSNMQWQTLAAAKAKDKWECKK